jgi:RNA polymerase sigma factor (sigma-70 family)
MSPEDASAIEALIPNLRRYARVLVRDADHADDVVQDCLERAITRFHCFTPGTNLRSWLFTILLNIVRSEARTNKRRGTVVNLDEIRDAAATTAPPEQPLTMRDLQHAFDQLPETFQEVVVLVAIEGMAYEEAAEIIGVPVGTVRSRLSRAREQLRRAMEAPVAPASRAARKPVSTVSLQQFLSAGGGGWARRTQAAAAAAPS